VTGNHVQDEWRAPLDDLRTLRESLREEEQRVSYWRQLVQGRLDLVRTALDGGHPCADDLASLAAARPRDGARRRSPAATSLALEGLVEAEVKLSAYRRALHERIDACTAQLVDHYQRDPAQIVR
jgi:uncharacterized protein (DUF1810 family)